MIPAIVTNGVNQIKYSEREHSSFLVDLTTSPPNTPFSNSLNAYIRLIKGWKCPAGLITRRDRATRGLKIGIRF